MVQTNIRPSASKRPIHRRWESEDIKIFPPRVTCSSREYSGVSAPCSVCTVCTSNLDGRIGLAFFHVAPDVCLPVGVGSSSCIPLLGTFFPLLRGLGEYQIPGLGTIPLVSYNTCIPSLPAAHTIVGEPGRGRPLRAGYRTRR